MALEGIIKLQPLVLATEGLLLSEADRPTAPVPSVDETVIAKLWAKSIMPGMTPGMTIKPQAGPSSAHSQAAARPRLLTDAGTQGGTLPDYELLDVIGEGGMGVVYRARQTAIDRNIAVKMLKPQLAAKEDQRIKFLAEAAVIGDLEHPNIVPIHDLGLDGQGRLFYAMKRVQGTPWSEVMGSRTEHENLETLLRVCDAVAFAHSKGVIHCDLKPENVMLGEYGEVLLMDWGLAASVSTEGKAESLSQMAGGGTPAYMAPEMARGEVDGIGPRSDIYLLGGILYEIVTGKPPHAGVSALNCVFNAAQNVIQPSPVKGELVEIALKSLATRPEDRHQTVKEFQLAVREYQGHFDSVAVADRAREHLDRAAQTGNHDDYAHALYGYRQAIELWADNGSARDGLAKATLDYAWNAYHKGDLDLAASLLDAMNPSHAKLVSFIEEAKLTRKEQARRAKEVERIDSELHIAKEIHAKLLPEKLPSIPGYEIFTAYICAEQVGGDYYDFFGVDIEKGLLGIVVADVSGKGFPGSMVMGTTRTILRMMAASNPSPADVLAKTNYHVARDIKRGMFVTMIYVILNVRTREMTVASAGHQPMVICRAADREVELVHPDGIALGFDKGPVFDRVIREQKVQLYKGDRVVLYTNGIVDCMDAGRRLYSRKRFHDFCRANSELRSKDFVRQVLNDLENHKGEAEQHDDITITTFRIVG